jgi:hypothetical protein
MSIDTPTGAAEMSTTKPALRNPTPQSVVIGKCHWERDGDTDRLIDEAGTVWQTFYRDGPHDTWAGSIQRHETMGDAV